MLRVFEVIQGGFDFLEELQQISLTIKTNCRNKQGRGSGQAVGVGGSGLVPGSCLTKRVKPTVRD